jgi:adenosylhomocysteinase
MKKQFPEKIYNQKADSQAGWKKINWAWTNMPVLQLMSEELESSQALAGLKIAISVHVEAKTACLALALARGGADVALTGCNPLSTQDDVAAALAESDVYVYCRHGVDETEYKQHLLAALSIRPHLVIDDGGDFARLLHTEARDLAENLLGGCEETTTGIRRLEALAAENKLLFPVIAINDARSKHLFDNRFGTGQSVWTAVMDLTNLNIAGRTVVVAGYGMCGKGVALRARGLGARVIVTEIDPVKAIEALMEGYDVMPLAQAAPVGDIFITVTGCKDVITSEHYSLMKNGAIMANAGHFDVEINLPQLAGLAEHVEEVRPGITAYQAADKTLYVLAAGRLVNLAGGDGHPVEIMDMSFSLQTAGILYLVQEGRKLVPAVYPLPKELDDQVAGRYLDHWQKRLDQLTPEQASYLSAWQPDN